MTRLFATSAFLLALCGFSGNACSQSVDDVLKAATEALKTGDIDALSELPASIIEGLEAKVEAAAENEVLAIDLSAVGAETAQNLGLQVTSRETLSGLGLTVVRLRLPSKLSRVVALFTLLRSDPLGLYSANNTYRLADGGALPPGAACAGDRCLPQQLIGWPLAGCPLPLRLGQLDGAVDAQQLALRGAALQQSRISPAAVTPGEAMHGTAIASVLVGQGPVAGLLPKAQLFAADVFAPDAHGQPATDAYRLLRGLDWLARQNVDAVNVSLAGPDSPVLHRAVQAFTSRGVAVAAAVGNQGPTHAALFPAAYPEVLAVTAVDRQLHPYANANQAGLSGIAAPGVAIWSAGEPQEQFREGTSYAAPFATAALALLKKAEPNVPLRMRRLRASSRDLGAPGADALTGVGLLRAPPCS